MMPPNSKGHRNFAHPALKRQQTLKTREVHPEKAQKQTIVQASYVIVTCPHTATSLPIVEKMAASAEAPTVICELP